MEIQYYLTEADILELMRYRLRQAPKRQNPILVRRLAYLVGFMLIALGSITVAKNVVLPVVFMALAIFSFFLYPVYFDWHLKRKVATTYRDESKRATLASRVLRVTDDGLEEKSSLGETKVKWEAIDNMDVTPTYAIFSIQAVPSIIIPKNRVGIGDYESFIGECRKYFKGTAA